MFTVGVFPSTCSKLVIQEQCRLATQLAVEQAAGLDGERVVVSNLQAADAEVGLCCVS